LLSLLSFAILSRSSTIETASENDTNIHPILFSSVNVTLDLLFLRIISVKPDENGVEVDLTLEMVRLTHLI
jgi:hypothetical protein